MSFKNEVFSLWIGSSLSIMEQACINSFLEKDTAFVLYVYKNLENVPVGTIIKDAHSVVPYSEYKQYDNPSYFSNLFRYKRLYELGGIWVDMDLMCLGSLLQIFKASEYIFSSELKNNEQHTNAGIIGCPAKSQVMLDCYNEVKRTTGNIKHGQLGPKLLKKHVTIHQLDHYVYPYYVFCYYSFREVDKIFKQNCSLEDDILCIHLWNNVLTSKCIDKSNPTENTLYYSFIKTYSPRETFKHQYQSYNQHEQYTINNTNNGILLAHSEAEAFSLKNENPNKSVVLLKTSFNAFLVNCNSLNTPVYDYVDKIILSRSIKNVDIKFNILKSLLKK